MLIPGIHIVVLLFMSILIISVTISVCSRYYSEGKGGMRVESKEGGNFTRFLPFTSPLLAQIRDRDTG